MSKDMGMWFRQHRFPGTAGFTPFSGLKVHIGFCARKEHIANREQMVYGVATVISGGVRRPNLRP
jgi:hypothetical protein